jgi:hypothetical protein
MDTVKRFLENCDAFAYSEDNPNAGYRYLPPPNRKNRATPRCQETWDPVSICR